MRHLDRGFSDSQCLSGRSAGVTGFAVGGVPALGQGRRLRGGWVSSPWSLEEPSAVRLPNHAGERCSCCVCRAQLKINTKGLVS